MIRKGPLRLAVALALAGTFITSQPAWADKNSADKKADETAAYEAYASYHYLTALKLAKQAAAKGSREAYTLIGEIYARGLGVPQDFTKAVDAYAKASDLGDPNAEFALANLVAAGKGAKQNMQLAADLFEKAAKTGHPGAEYNLALIYLSGDGRKVDWGKAASWMRKAAEQGNMMAEYGLGAFYKYGRGLPKDKAKAAEWIGKAAEAGLADAQVEYGIILFRGEGIPVDKARGADFIRRSADQRNPVAQDRLARLYAYGVVVQKNLVEAEKWRLLAQAAGESDPNLDRMLAKLTPEQKDQARQAARRWATEGFNSAALKGATFRTDK